MQTLYTMNLVLVIEVALSTAFRRKRTAHVNQIRWMSWCVSRYFWHMWSLRLQQFIDKSKYPVGELTTVKFRVIDSAFGCAKPRVYFLLCTTYDCFIVLRNTRSKPVWGLPAAPRVSVSVWILSTTKRGIFLSKINYFSLFPVPIKTVLTGSIVICTLCGERGGE